MKIPYRTKTKLIDIDNLNADDICIEDIACSLAGQARFNGITRPVYTVAQHSVLCSLMSPEGYELAALLHDAHEYILGDICKPVADFINNGLIEIDAISDIKMHIDNIIRTKYYTKNRFDDDVILEIDNRMLATEMVAFFGTNYLSDFEPYPGSVVAWDTDKAERMFLGRFHELCKY